VSHIKNEDHCRGRRRSLTIPPDFRGGAVVHLAAMRKAWEMGDCCCACFLAIGARRSSSHRRIDRDESMTCRDAQRIRRRCEIVPVRAAPSTDGAQRHASLSRRALRDEPSYAGRRTWFVW
jgi:hypothetical protein